MNNKGICTTIHPLWVYPIRHALRLIVFAFWFILPGITLSCVHFLFLGRNIVLCLSVCVVKTSRDAL